MVNISGLRFTLGERVLFNNESLLIRKGDRIGLVGPNGSGKSTIFKVITGREKADDGFVAVDPVQLSVISARMSVKWEVIVLLKRYSQAQEESLK